MAIGFVRVGFISRSKGGNACARAAYQARARVIFYGTDFNHPQTYDWSHQEPAAYHVILLPEGADPRYKDMDFLWNKVEQTEKRKDSQVAMEGMFALPDDEMITLEDRIEIAVSYYQKYYVDKGLIVQIDIHPPTEKAEIDLNTGEVIKVKSNWHAHAMMTTRLLKENGLDFQEHKARHLMPLVKTLPVSRQPKVVEACNNTVNGINHLNAYFEKKGYDLKVDESAIVPQEHLGPVRMRHPSFDYVNYDIKKELNELECQNPEKVLKKITETKSYFTRQDVSSFLEKHLPREKIETVNQKFWDLSSLRCLAEPTTGYETNLFTTQFIIDEERKILRLADHIQKNKAFELPPEVFSFKAPLNLEQQKAFQAVIEGSQLSCIEGAAGTGKSYLLTALKDAYESQGYTVRGLAPDYSTVEVLREKGFENAKTLHRFLFLNNFKQEKIQKNQEVWIIDESTKIGNGALLELLRVAKQNKVQLVLCGDSGQHSSVARGGLFSVLSNKYQAEYLTDIKRQKSLIDQQISKDLANGQTGIAVDSIIRNGSLNLVNDNEQVKEALIRKWAADQVAFPNQSSIIIAHKNKDIMDLNELIRIYRKQKGELGNQDFSCKSLHGDILVSLGDYLEFRFTDKKIGIRNGMKGTLIDASPKKFTVVLDEIDHKNDKKKVSFDPNYYHSFQLGYVCTNYRSQGRTVNQAYVLHTKGTSDKGFYVGLTRHIERVHLFVSREEAPYLMELKRQAAWKRDKLTTLDFTTKEEILEKTHKIKHDEHIQELKVSASVIDKTAGYGLSLWDQCKLKISKIKVQLTDLKKDKDFYNPLINDQNYESPTTQLSGSIYEEYAKYNKCLDQIHISKDYVQPTTQTVLEPKRALNPELVCLVQSMARQNSMQDLERENLTSSIQIEREPIQIQDLENKNLAASVQIKQESTRPKTLERENLTAPIGQETIQPKTLENENLASSIQIEREPIQIQDLENKNLTASIQIKQESIQPKILKSDTRHKLSEKNQQALIAYQQSKEEAAQWYTVVKTVNSKQTEWKAACIERNLLAYQVTQSISKEKLLHIFSKSALDILQSQALKYVAIQKGDNIAELENKLKASIEQLTYALFPEGPTKKDSKSLRFGSKGALCITCRGDKTGVFYDHEKKEGGGPLRLIQYRLGYDLQEAKAWAQNFLGQEISLPSQFVFKKVEKESSWLSLKPEAPAPSLEKLAPKLNHFYQETARHAYKDVEGNLLFYVLRLVDRNDPRQKTIRPLSYGTNGKIAEWQLKGYQTDKRPLYHLEQLKQNSKVLIVEGEKTADAATKLFPNVICVTWAGGAAAVAKTDWSVLYNREVVIWPDNDEAGFKAADEICSELRKVGVKSLGVVDKDVLKREFPAKWDLADPQPEKQPAHLLKTLLLSPNDKAVGLDQLTRDLKCIQKIEEKDLLVAKLQAKEILWRVEVRMRPELEKKWGGRYLEINQEIMKETLQIMSKKEAIEKHLQNDLGIRGEIKHKIAYQAMLHEALVGKPISAIKTEEMKQIMTNTTLAIKDMKEWQPYIENKVWSAVLESNCYVKQKNVASFFQNETLEVSKQLMQIVKQETPLQQQKIREIELSL